MGFKKAYLTEQKVINDKIAAVKLAHELGTLADGEAIVLNEASLSIKDAGGVESTVTATVAVNTLTGLTVAGEAALAKTGTVEVEDADGDKADATMTVTAGEIASVVLDGSSAIVTDGDDLGAVVTDGETTVEGEAAVAGGAVTGVTLEEGYVIEADEGE